jgi:hypothetical protein
MSWLSAEMFRAECIGRCRKEGDIDYPYRLRGGK